MKDVLNRNVEYMNDVSVGFDVVIVCTSNKFQADFWQTRLEGGRGTSPECYCATTRVQSMRVRVAHFRMQSHIALSSVG